MVNVDNGTAKDYEDLIAHVIEASSPGVRLEPEVRVLPPKNVSIEEQLIEQNIDSISRKGVSAHRYRK